MTAMGQEPIRESDGGHAGMSRSVAAWKSFGLLLAGFLAGCGHKQPQVAPSQPPVIPVSRPVERQVTDYVDFTGRTDAVQSVDVRPRVTGYLTQTPFKEGAEVKKGELLFEIDPRPYQAQLDQALAQVDLNKASLRLARATLARDEAVARAVPGGVSPQQLDQDQAMVDEAIARVKAYQASTEVYRLNLSFCQVTSPIDGKVSRYYLTVGNLVNQDQTLLTTVVSLDPTYAYFDMDEPTLLRIREAINEGKIKLPEDGVIPVLMGLQGETGYPHLGRINFANNQVNPTTGSLTLRGVFPNPKPREVADVASGVGQVARPSLTGLLGWAADRIAVSPGTRLLSAGMFVRIRLPIGTPHPALLVIDRAIGSDQGLKYVCVLGADNTVQYRRVTTGALQPDGLRVISSGLTPDDWVVVGGLQQVRPGMTIHTDQVQMPTLNNPVAAPVGAKPLPPAGVMQQAGKAKP